MILRDHHSHNGLFSTTVQSKTNPSYSLDSIICFVVAIVLTGCSPTEKTNHKPDTDQTSNTQSTFCDKNNKQGSSNTITAEVVALEQIITFNRFGAFNPAGMVYALRRDVVDDSCSLEEEDTKKSCHLDEVDDDDIEKFAGKVRLGKHKRPRPLVLRVNECSYLQVKFWNLLSPLPTNHTRFPRADFPEGGVVRHSVQITQPKDPKATDISTPPRCFDGSGNKIDNATNCKNLFPFPRQEEPDYPTTRAASLHVNGLDYLSMDSDGANVGNNKSSLAEPGTNKTYTWFARQEGGYFFYSDGALAGGEGDGGQLGLGLFGSVNVEPKGSVWYRSQVTHEGLTSAKSGSNPHYDDINYEKLAILGSDNQIVHSDLNAIIYQPNTKDKDGVLHESDMDCSKQSPGSSCGMSFREFTTIFHDENKVFQAFAELADEDNPVSTLADGMAINYGSSGTGSAVLANKKGLGPTKDCPDCKLEEFFLSSWANGDPAMIVRRNMDGKAVEALYPDDPSNVHHSYLGDPVRFRNIHAGPKETHVFHLHAHQWLQDKNDPNANYLDSQTISPGSSYTYDIQYGGGGNRNLTVGDAIFHCHLYPHFAAGMWELWRNHDVFEDGKPGYFDNKKPISTTNDPTMRNLPDGELAEKGAPNPAIVPIPGYPLAPLPSAEFRGYPFYIAGEKGHRPPQPPLDMARDAQGKELNGGLPRHVITKGENFDNTAPEMQADVLLREGGSGEATKAARYIAKRTWKLNSDKNNLAMALKLKSAHVKLLPQCGTKEELLAMAFHAGWTKQQIEKMKTGELPPDMPEWCKSDVMQALADLDSTFKWDHQSEVDANWPYRKINSGAMSPLWEAKGYKSGLNSAAPSAYNPGQLFRINGYAPAQGAPFAEPCPKQYYDKSTNKGSPVTVNRDQPRLYKTAYIQFDLTVNKYGWHDPQARMPVLEEDAAATINGSRLAEPLFFRANSGECIQFQATNLIPSVLNLDDFQVYTPTDTVGQHIHLVKFDATASDGSANGWNYEDGTFSPDEVRERIVASSKSHGGSAHNWNGQPVELKPLAYKLPNGTSKTKELGNCSGIAKEDNEKHPWCGAQATIQRWWADPVLNDKWDDRTMRAVFTHDHYGPSSHQQHGFYGALIVEPRDSVWTQLGGSPDKVVNTANGISSLNCAENSNAIGDKALGGSLNSKPAKCGKRNDGGPTSYAANIGFIDKASNEARKEEVRREYNLAFADFAILYDTDLRPINPPSRQDELMLPYNVRHGLKPKPEGISTEDPGTRLLNYRNEPIPLRIAEEDKDSLEYHQKPVTPDGNGKGDMANVFSSLTHNESKSPKSAKERVAKLQSNVPHEIIDKTELTQLIGKQITLTNNFKNLLTQNEPWRVSGDPSTPVLAAYIGEPLKLHLIQGAQEEQHVFSMTGMKWLAEPKSQNSGYMNGQQIGISEHFEFDTPVPSGATDSTDYWFGSPAVENLWDGMWGLLRSYGVKGEDNTNLNIKKLARLPEIDPPPFVMGESSTCPDFLPTVDKNDSTLPYEQNHHKEFHIGAWLARDLLPSGKLVYNERFGINDPNAIVFVQQDETWGDNPMEILHHLQDQYKAGKNIEPLILRVNAGDCITAFLTNYLPETMAGLDGRDVMQSWSYNLLPPIVNGFNFSQVQGSSQINLQPQLLTYNAKSDDGSNKIGLNSCKELSSDDTTGKPNCTNAPIFSNLPKPCKKSGLEFGNCKSRQFEWYAGDVKFATHKLPKPFEEAVELDVTGRTITEQEFDNTDFFVQSFDTADGKKAWAHYTPIEFGAVSLLEFGDVIKHSSHGAIAALIVEPRDAILADSKALSSQASATITLPKNKQFKEFVLLMQDDLSLRQNGQAMPNHRMADDSEDTGQKGFNYRTEPLWARNGVGTSGADFNELNQVDYTDTLSSHKNIAPCVKPCDPKTPIFEASAGESVRFRVVHPGGHSRQHAFVLHGHNWDYQPWVNGSTQQFDRTDTTKDNIKLKTARVGAIGGIGPSRHLNILTTAGGKCSIPGDYLFRVQEQFQFQGGMWGIFRVGGSKGDLKC